jgi:nucleotide-binding universal stress UspA family protein
LRHHPFGEPEHEKQEKQPQRGFLGSWPRKGTMYRLLLVPLDGSPFAEQALPLAVAISKRAAAELQLIFVHNPSEPDYPEHHLLAEDSWMTALKTRHRAYLDQVTERLRAGGANIRPPLVLQGEVAATIHRHVVEKQVDLVVMTTHARSPVARMWLGSVADQLIRELPKPLLLIRPVEQKADATADVVVKHMLLPLDGTPLAEQIITPAVALGDLMEADYTLLRVIRPAAPVHYPAEGVALGPLPESMLKQLQRMETEVRDKAHEYLDDVARRLRGHRVGIRVAEEAQPAQAVIDATKKVRADVVAMQTHGRRGLSRLILGSVADKVLRGSVVPLLVQRPLPS